MDVDLQRLASTLPAAMPEDVRNIIDLRRKPTQARIKDHLAVMQSNSKTEIIQYSPLHPSSRAHDGTSGEILTNCTVLVELLLQARTPF